jgi:hypothetical protein
MIIGAHSIIYSRQADADRAFLRDVLRLSSVDVGGGWLIFGLPPAEVAVHPGDRNNVHEFYLLCDDIEAFVTDMKQRRIECAEVMHLDWGSMTHVRLPGGGKLGVYQPKHARPRPMNARRKRRRPAAKKNAAKKKAKKNRKKTSRRRQGRVR